MFTRTLVAELNGYPNDAWAELRNGKELTSIRLGDLLRPYGVGPRTIWIGDCSAKGYLEADPMEVFRRYISRAQCAAFVKDQQEAQAARPGGGEVPGNGSAVAGVAGASSAA